MPRLIDADALKMEILCRLTIVSPDVAKYANGVLNFIANAPTIEAETVRHGSIIETIEGGRMKRVFSCCGTDFTKMTCWMMPNYCPNCGAKLHGGATDVSD